MVKITTVSNFGGASAAEVNQITSLTESVLNDAGSGSPHETVSIEIVRGDGSQSGAHIHSGTHATLTIDLNQVNNKNVTYSGNTSLADSESTNVFSLERVVVHEGYHVATGYGHSNTWSQNQHGNWVRGIDDPAVSYTNSWLGVEGTSQEGAVRLNRTRLCLLAKRHLKPPPKDAIRAALGRDGP